jgi:rod shape determining protein RodA
MNRRESTIANIDWITLFLYFMLIGIGWLNIYAAVYNEEHQSIFDLSQNYGKQLLWISLSVAIAISLLIIDSRFFSTFAYPIYIAVILLLISVIFIGKEVNGAKAWIQIGGFSLQASEFGKFATALLLAKYLSSQKRNLSRIKHLIPAGIIIFLPALIILLQKDTGSAMVYAVFILTLYREGLSGNWLVIGFFAALFFVLALIINKYYLIAGIFSILAIMYWRWKALRSYKFILLGIFVLSSAYITSIDYAVNHILEPHQRIRIQVLLGLKQDKYGAGYNVNQSKIAIGSGQAFGKGFLQGTQTKFDFVPEQSTDFIFCTIGEEWGFAGSVFLILTYLALFYRLLFLAERQRSSFNRIYGYSVTAILFFHFTINLSMTIGLFPIVGIPLPFISYGGSSLFAFTILLFIFIKQDAQRYEYI